MQKSCVITNYPSHWSLHFSLEYCFLIPTRTWLQSCPIEDLIIDHEEMLSSNIMVVRITISSAAYYKSGNSVLHKIQNLPILLCIIEFFGHLQSLLAQKSHQFNSGSNRYFYLYFHFLTSNIVLYLISLSETFVTFQCCLRLIKHFHRR